MEEPTNPEPNAKRKIEPLNIEVKQKKKPISTKFKSIFFGGDVKLAGGYVLGDILIPAFKNMIVDMWTRGNAGFAERLVYGESRIQRPPNPFGGRQSIQSYNSVFGDPRPELIGPVRHLPDQRSAIRSGRVNRKDVSNIVVGTKEQAEDIVERMFDMLGQYEGLTLLDFYVLLGQPTSPIDTHWGWTDLRGIDIRQIREGWLIELPPLEPVNVR